MTTRRTTLLLHDCHRAHAGGEGIRQAIEAVPGVAHVHVNLATEMVYVQYDDASCSRVQLTAALDAMCHGGHATSLSSQSCSGS